MSARVYIMATATPCSARSGGHPCHQQMLTLSKLALLHIQLKSCYGQTGSINTRCTHARMLSPMHKHGSAQFLPYKQDMITQVPCTLQQKADSMSHIHGLHKSMASSLPGSNRQNHPNLQHILALHARKFDPSFSKPLSEALEL